MDTESTLPMLAQHSGIADDGESHTGRSGIENIRCYVVTGDDELGAKQAASRLAERLGYFHIDGSRFHSRRSLKKMAAGRELDEGELRGWLTTLSGELAAARMESWPVVLSCQALERSHKELLRKGDPELVFVHLAGEVASEDDSVSPAPPMHRLDTVLLMGEERGVVVNATAPFEEVMRTILEYRRRV